LQRDSLIHVPSAELRVPGMPVPLITFNCSFYNVSCVYGLVCLVCSTSAQAWKSLRRTEASATPRLHCVDANHRADLFLVTDGCMLASWLVRSVTNNTVLTLFTSAKQIGLESITLLGHHLLTPDDSACTPAHRGVRQLLDVGVTSVHSSKTMFLQILLTIPPARVLFSLALSALRASVYSHSLCYHFLNVPWSAMCEAGTHCLWV
jgi:hypothetical protein